MIKKIYLYFIHSILILFYKKEYIKFKNSNIYITQENKLKEILQKNKTSLYGKKYNFEKMKTIKEFQKNIPLSTYEDYIPYIEKIKNGKINILTSEKVNIFELTSGSSSASKLIPYTNGLKNEFQTGIKTWLYLLYTKYPKLKYGKSYWSITPVISSTKYEKNTVPIGFEEDSEYFGKFEKYLINFLFVIPKDIKKETNIDIFYLKTAISLLNCKNLRLISIWSPTFLILLLEFIENNSETVLNNLKKRRKKEIENYIYSKKYNKIWKNLEVISCWGESNSSQYLDVIQNLFPKTIIQEKGLLATECFVSFPDTTKFGNALSYHSHFFEFISEMDNKIYTISNLKEKEKYELIVTTSGGFYRYKTGDIIEITHIKNKLPYIKFIGRKGIISDLFGEKLNELFLKDVLNFFNNNNFDISFAMFAPKENHYVLYIKSDFINKELSTSKQLFTKEELDNKLRENFHYDYCRKLGQLEMIKIFKLTGNCEKEYIEHCQNQGQKLGNIKLKTLSNERNWDKIFTGFYI